MYLRLQSSHSIRNLQRQPRITLSTQNATFPKCTKSGNSDSSISHGTNSNCDFVFIGMCPDEFESLNVADFKGVTFWVECVTGPLSCERCGRILRAGPLSFWNWHHKWGRLQHTATYCNILQHTATYCNILQHTATLENDTTSGVGSTYIVHGRMCVCVCICVYVDICTMEFITCTPIKSQMPSEDKVCPKHISSRKVEGWTHPLSVTEYSRTSRSN